MKTVAFTIDLVARIPDDVNIDEHLSVNFDLRDISILTGPEQKWCRTAEAIAYTTENAELLEDG